MPRNLTLMEHADALRRTEDDGGPAYQAAREALRAAVDALPIATVEITHYNVGPSKVRGTVVMDGATLPVDVFTYYPDEIQFTVAELVGMTLQDARTLRAMRDMAYLLEPPTRS